MQWLREPMVQFIVLGILLFIVHDWLDSGSATIHIDRSALTGFIQNRTGNYTDGQIEQLSEAALADVIRQYLREEVLYRKALIHGMDTDDYVIRRRLVQKMEFLAEGGVEEPGEDELLEYYEENGQEFALPADVTFTHVFFSDERHGSRAVEIAGKTLTTLNQEKVSFDASPRFGERFPYQLNYVERPEDEVASHFGEEMAEAVFQLEASESWQGPLRSEFGVHLILLIDRREARLPAFDEIRPQIQARVRSMKIRQNREAGIATMIDEFEIVVSDEFKGAYDPAGQ